MSITESSPPDLSRLVDEVGSQTSSPFRRLELTTEAGPDASPDPVIEAWSPPHQIAVVVGVSICLWALIGAGAWMAWRAFSR